MDMIKIANTLGLEIGEMFCIRGFSTNSFKIKLNGLYDETGSERKGLIEKLLSGEAVYRKISDGKWSDGSSVRIYQ